MQPSLHSRNASGIKQDIEFVIPIRTEVSEKCPTGPTVRKAQTRPGEIEYHQFKNLHHDSVELNGRIQTPTGSILKLNSIAVVLTRKSSLTPGPQAAVPTPATLASNLSNVASSSTRSTGCFAS